MKSLVLCRFTFTQFKLYQKPNTFVKWTAFLILLLAVQLTHAQQAASIKGTVKTSDGKPASSVTITLKETGRATTVDQDGKFTLNRIKPGNYTLVASFIGFTPQIKQVEVKSHETVTVDLMLSESSQQLSEVVVSGSRANKFTNLKTDYVARVPLTNLENPQVYSTVTSALMQEQMVTDLGGALKNVPGVTPLLQGDGSGGDFASRGFVTDAYLRNGMTAYMSSAVDPANLERIEAIKGPSATLFGSSFTSYGGLFNRVTKKPLDTVRGEISYTAGGFGLSRLTADYNTPVNTDKTALFRINVADEHDGSFMDAGFSDRLFIAPSFSYQINDRLSVLVDAEIYSQKGTPAFRFFPEVGFNVTTPKQLNFDYTRSFTNNDVTAESPTTNVYAQVNYKISNSWHSQTNISYTNTAYSGIFQWSCVLPGDATVERDIDDENDHTNIFELQQNFIGDFKTGSIRHRLVAGLDLLGYNDNGAYGYMAFDTTRVNGSDPEYSRLTGKSLNAALANVPYSHDINKQYDYAAYASDVINLTDKFIAMLSVRVDRFDNQGDQDIVADTLTGKYVQTTVSPKFGLVYQIVKDKVSLFGNYMNGFTNENGSDHNHNPFKPEQANQLEGGVKLNLLDGKFTSTISYYDIKVNDVLRTDPNFPLFEIQDGTQYSKGLEAEVISNPFPGFNIVAGYAHNDSKYENIDPTLNGYRPESAGPADVANLWLSYFITHGGAKGLGLGFGGNYAGKNNIVNESDGVFTLPAYTVLNATAFYDQPKYRIGIKVDNITNKEYWVGWDTIIPQMPRRFSASLTLKF
jgi:iron complex outermembrane receptor protein